MDEASHYEDPLAPEERAEFEGGLISFCDRELDLLGDIHGLRVLYAGGVSPLWIEGLSQRIGENGSVAALEADRERVEDSRRMLDEMDLAAPIRLVAGDVFEPPFEPGGFDLAYSAGLFHELDVRERSAEDALASLAATVRPGGRVATSDFVDSVPAAQIEDEELERELTRSLTGAELYGIGPPRRLISLHERKLADVRWLISPPREIPHLDRLALAEFEKLEIFDPLPTETRKRLLAGREALMERIRREGYSRPATLYVEGTVA